MSYSNINMDEPIQNKNQDMFEISKYADALVDFIEITETPITISIQGEWGSGKTSLLNLINQGLIEKNPDLYEIIQINTWEFFINDSRDEAIDRFILSIIKEIVNRTDTGKLVKQVKTIQNYSKLFLSKGLNLLSSYYGIEDGGKEVMSLFFDNESLMFAKQLRNSLVSLMEANRKTPEQEHKTYIFMIDDMDRLDPELSVKLLEVFKNIFDLKHCIFILAIDYNIIYRGLDKKYEGYFTDNKDKNLFKDYFDKLIQLPFIMPQKSYKVSRILMNGLFKSGYFTEDNVSFATYNIIEKITETTIGYNPRKVKRLINSILLSYSYDKKNQLILSNTNRKVLNILLICLQLEYPIIYGILQRFPDYTNWTELLLSEYMYDYDHSTYIDENIDVDSSWNKLLYAICFNTKGMRNSISPLFELFRILDQLVDGGHTFIIARIMSLSDISNIYAKSSMYNGKDYNNHSKSQFKQGQKLLDFIRCKDNEKILDIGCGNGLTTIELYRRNENVMIDAFDISESQIAMAVENRDKALIPLEKIHFYVLDALALNSVNEYHLIFSNSSLHWVLDAKKMYMLIYRALKPQGLLAIHQGAEGTYKGLHKIVRTAIRHLKLDNYYENWHFPANYPSAQEMENLLKHLGFCNIYVQDDQSDGSEYPNLVFDFAKASLIHYYAQIPSEYHQPLEDEYFKLCASAPVDTYTHRIYILAGKP